MSLPRLIPKTQILFNRCNPDASNFCASITSTCRPVFAELCRSLLVADVVKEVKEEACEVKEVTLLHHRDGPSQVLQASSFASQASSILGQLHAKPTLQQSCIAY